jgi:hypothetical protein
MAFGETLDHCPEVKRGLLSSLANFYHLYQMTFYEDDVLPFFLRSFVKALYLLIYR